MKSAIGRALWSGMLVSALIAVSVGSTAAQATRTPVSPSPPVTVKGWSYEVPKISGMHTFYCNPPICTSKSTIVYVLHPPRTMTFDDYRRSAEPILKQRQAMVKDGTRFELLGVEDKSTKNGDVSVRMYRTRTTIAPANGPKRFMINGYIFGAKSLVSITSSAESEKAADKNFMQFGGPLWLLADGRLEKGKQ